jgi:hypothetical protein
MHSGAYTFHEAHKSITFVALVAMATAFPIITVVKTFDMVTIANSVYI